MKAASERGVIGAWAYQARQELGLSVEQVAEAMAGRSNPVSPATIRGIESGSKQPGARLLRVLSQVLDSAPPGATKEPGLSEDVTGLVTAMTAALLAQTQALSDLRADLAETRQDADEQREAMTRMLARLEAQLAELAPPGDTAAAAVAPGTERR